MSKIELDVQITSLTKRFKQKEIIKNLSLSVERGSFISILGPSGCGKSTLLRLIAGIESPTSGEIQVNDEVQKSLGFVFQEPNLLPWLTVLENVMLPFELGHGSKISQTERIEKGLDALAKVKLKSQSHLFPHELSGGMKMRVSLARALVNTPRLLLLDEPLSALDDSTRFEIQNHLLKLWELENMTVIFVTHSLTEAVFLSQKIFGFKKNSPGDFYSTTINLPHIRTDDHRTSPELNDIVRLLSQELRI